MTEKSLPDPLQALPGFAPNAPQYYDDPAIDQLMNMVLNLGAEVWALRDRQAMLEEELLQSSHLDPEVLDKRRPSEALAARLKEEREEFICRIYADLFAAYGGDKVGGKSVVL